MQYPIIDLITDAYINNGWTGLDVIKGKNLCDSDIIQGAVDYRDGSIIEDDERIRTEKFISLDSGSYTISYAETDILLVGYVYINNTFSDSYSFRSNWNNSPFTFTVPDNFSLILAFKHSNNTIILPVDLPDLQIESGTNATPYEPYKPPTTDIAHRLKLPLPYYFPHPVIDALQRAAAGTQTADDIEVLRYYLTPLGIGGI